MAHLENCKALVQDFEVKLKAEKDKDKPPGTGRGRGRPRLSAQPASPVKITPKKPTTPPTSNVIITTTPGGLVKNFRKVRLLLKSVAMVAGSLHTVLPTH